jgi:hypothetical protein
MHAKHVRVTVEDDDAGTVGNRGTQPDDRLGGVPLHHLDLGSDLVSRSYRRQEAPPGT